MLVWTDAHRLVIHNPPPPSIKRQTNLDNINRLQTVNVKRARISSNCLNPIHFLGTHIKGMARSRPIVWGH